MPRTAILDHSADQRDARCDKGSGTECLGGLADLWDESPAQLRPTDPQGHSQETGTEGRTFIQSLSPTHLLFPGNTHRGRNWPLLKAG